MAAVSAVRTGLASGAAILILWLAVLGIYGQTLSFDFVPPWDDYRNISGNPHIRELSGAELRWMFTDTTYVRMYMPLSWLSFAIIHRVLGPDPRGFHLANVLLHAVNATLVFFLLRTLLAAGRRPGEGVGRDVILAAFAGALFWSVHPLRVEVVAWASELLHGQAAFFALAAALLFLRAASGTTAIYRRPAYWAAWLAYVASLVTYPHAVTVSFLLLFAAVGPLRLSSPLAREQWTGGASTWAKVPFLAASVLALLPNAWGRMHSEFFGQAPSLAEFGVVERAMQAFYVWAHFLRVLLWPVGLSPTDTTLQHIDPLSPLFLGSAVVVLGLTGLALALCRRFPGLLAVWFSYLAILVPFLGLTEHPHVAADRYMHLASIPWSLLLGWLVLHILHGHYGRTVRAATLGLIFAAAVPLAGLAHLQTLVWRDSVSLFSHMIRKLGADPGAADIWWRLGQYLLSWRGDTAGAIACFDRTLAQWPNHAVSLQLKGMAQAQAGDLAAAAATLRQAVAVSPKNAESYARLADVLSRLGQKAEALAAVDEAGRLAPQSPGIPLLRQRIESAPPGP